MFFGTQTDPPVGSTDQRRIRAIFNALRTAVRPQADPGSQESQEVNHRIIHSLHEKAFRAVLHYHCMVRPIERSASGEVDSWRQAAPGERGRAAPRDHCREFRDSDHNSSGNFAVMFTVPK
jgi:hypothetical protein